jgi:hypothetical protein
MRSFSPAWPDSNVLKPFRHGVTSRLVVAALVLYACGLGVRGVVPELFAGPGASGAAMLQPGAQSFAQYAAHIPAADDAAAAAASLAAAPVFAADRQEANAAPRAATDGRAATVPAPKITAKTAPQTLPQTAAANSAPSSAAKTVALKPVPALSAPAAAATTPSDPAGVAAPDAANVATADAATVATATAKPRRRAHAQRPSGYNAWDYGFGSAYGMSGRSPFYSRPF